MLKYLEFKNSRFECLMADTQLDEAMLKLALRGDDHVQHWTPVIFKNDTNLFTQFEHTNFRNSFPKSVR